MMTTKRTKRTTTTNTHTGNAMTEHKLDNSYVPVGESSPPEPSSSIDPIEIGRKVDQFKVDAAPTFTVWDIAIRVLNGEVDSLQSPAQVNYTIALPTMPGSDRPVVSFNKMLEPYRTLLSKLGVNIPWAGAMPASSSPDDVAKAQAAEALLAYWFQQQKFDQKMVEAISWLLVTGNVGLYLCQYNQETKFEVVSPYNYFLEPGLSSPDDSRWVVIQRWATKKELAEMFPDHAKAIETTMPAGVGNVVVKSYSPATGYSNSQPQNRLSYWEYISKSGDFAYILPDKNLVLFESRLPADCFPFFPLRYTIVPGRMYGQGVIVPAVQPQRLYNAIRTQILLNAQLVGSPKVLVHNMDAANADDGFLDTPGQVLRYGGDADLATPPPAFLSAPPIPQYVMTEPQNLHAEILGVMGVSSVSLGKRQAGVTSGKAIMALAENDSSQLSTTMQQIEFCVAHISRSALVMMKTYMPESVMIRQLDRYGAPVHRELKATDLSDETPEIFIDSSTLFRVRAEERRSQVLSDLQLGLISPQEAKELLRTRKASLPDLTYMQDLRHAKEVLEAVVATRAPARFYKRDNLEVLARVFDEFMRTPDFYALDLDLQELVSQQYEAILDLISPPSQPTQLPVSKPPTPQASDMPTEDAGLAQAETIPLDVESPDAV